MPKIAIISGSVRIGRQSHQVARYFLNYLTENKLAEAEILDLKEFNFPVLEERLSHTSNPTAEMTKFSEKIAAADAVIVVSPEYNSGLPAAVKNAIDLLYNEWYRKPIGLVTVSSGPFGGLHALTQLQTVFIKVRAVLAPAYFPVPNVQNAFAEDGTPTDKATTDKRAATFTKELLWLTESVTKNK